MSVAENNKISEIEFESTKKQKGGGKVLTALISIMPWAIVGSLLYAGLFIKPGATIEEVIPPAIHPRDKIYGIASLGSDDFLLAGDYGKILITHDKGHTWQAQNSLVKSHLQDISAWDKEHAIAVGNLGIIVITDDGGKTWTEVESPKSEIANRLIKVHTYAGGEAWTVGDMGAILRSTDYGKTWTRMREEEDVYINDIVRVDDQTIFATGEIGRIFKSGDNGETWEDIETDSPNSFTSIAFKNPQVGVTVGLDGVIVGTEDGGETWTMIESDKSGMTEHLTDVKWSDELDMWVGVGNKGMWIKFSSDLKEFEAENLSEIDLTSHTELAFASSGFIAVGATVGAMDFESKVWSTLGN